MTKDRMALPVHCCVVGTRLPDDPTAAALVSAAHALGVPRLQAVECLSLYFVEGQLTSTDLDQLASALFVDSAVQTAAWRAGSDSQPGGHLQPGGDAIVVETALRPGVTDPIADKVVRYASVVGVPGVRRAATGQRYVLRGPLTQSDVDGLIQRLLVNPVIQHFRLGEIEPSFPQDAEASGRVVSLPLRGLDQDSLLAVSAERRAALDVSEMLAIQTYFDSLGRPPTDAEFETIAQTWSEHCVHKTFRASIAVQDEAGKPQGVVDGLLKTYIRAATEQIDAPWVRSAFVDNAGIIDFDDAFEVSFKVETHNHPSAIEPFGGANTGVGGVIRDILGVSAKPIAATDILCFGPVDTNLELLPAGVLPPRRIRDGVVAGVRDYGNKIGVPTVNGAIWYDAGYTANPLVFCGCVGLAPKGRHPSQPRPGDRVVVLGGRTGRDGLRGATFSSMTMDAQTGEVAGASVQIGDPIVEKGLIEVIIRARDAGLYSGVTDCGAGGLSSAVGEMASQTGARVELASVKLKYPGLAPWEIWLSEAQERMVLAVPPDNLQALERLCENFGVELTDIGEFTNSGYLTVYYDGRVVLDLSNDFLHHGRPRRSMVAVIPSAGRKRQEDATAVDSHPADLSAVLLGLLAHPNIASKAPVVRTYDHEVQGGTVVKPLTGAENDGPSDACVLKPQATGGWRGLVISNGINPEYGKRDPYRMAHAVVDEAIRNAVAVGADPTRIALLDNFCWGDPQRPDALGALVEAARGCHDAAIHYGAPFISGKDSLNNEYLGVDGQRHAIPPTLLISAIGLMDDVRQAVSMDFKQPGAPVYLIGSGMPVLGGSHLRLVAAAGQAATDDGEVPGPVPDAPATYQRLHQAIGRGFVAACHDLSEGGLAVAAAEMCIGGRLGLEMNIGIDAHALVELFGESNGRLLVEVRPGAAADFEAIMTPSTWRRVGEVNQEPRLTIRSGGAQAEIVTLAVDELLAAWQGAPER